MEENFRGRAVYKPDILSTVKDFQLIICVCSYEDRTDIISEALEKFGIKKEQIVSANQMLIDMLRSR